jgi:hypothetical protein
MVTVPIDNDLVLVAALILRLMSDIDAPRFEKGAQRALLSTLVCDPVIL